MSSPGQVVLGLKEAETANQLMRLEYLTAVFKPATDYSLEQPKEFVLEDGSLEQRPVNEVFQVVQVHTNRARPKVIPTVLTRTDKSMTSKLALYIQPLAIFHPHGAPVGPLHVMAEADPYWVTPDDLAPFLSLIHI